MEIMQDWQNQILDREGFNNNKTTNTKMENLNQFEVLFVRNEQPVLMLLPFWSCHDALDHIMDVVGKRPKSLKRL